MINLESVSEIYSLKFYKDNKVINENIYALKNLSLDINYGEVINIIGSNGSGKSTLLKIICGLIEPFEGTVKVFGKVGLIIDIGCGFHPDLTGRENILAAASLYGHSKEDVISVIPEILEFSELGKYFDAPIRTYSQGMYLRLAFSFAVSMSPDILCIDDIITVGDELYRQRCLTKICDFKKAGKTIILVTHDLLFAAEFASRTIWINKGEILFDGDTKQAIDKYRSFLKHSGIIEFLDISPFTIKGKTDSARVFYKNNELIDISKLLISFHASTLLKYDGKENGFDHFQITEKGQHFIKLKAVNMMTHCALEIITAINFETLNIEFFVENLLGNFKGEALFKFTLPISLIIKELIAVDSEYFYLSEKNECYFNILDNDSSINIEFSPPISKNDILIANGSVINFTLRNYMPTYNEIRKRILLLKLNFKKGHISERDLYLKIKDNHNKNKICISNSFIQFEGHGFCFKRNDLNLFTFNGIEFLFIFNGVECSSNKAKISIDKIDAVKGEMIISYSNESWPLKVSIKLELKNSDCLSITWCTDFIINEAKIENLRFELLFNNDYLKKVDEFNDYSTDVLFFRHESEYLSIKNETNKDLFLFSHCYEEKEKSAIVAYILDKSPLKNKEYKIECIFNNKKIINPKIFQKQLDKLIFNNGSITLKFLDIETFIGWKNYVSFFYNNIWHDSLKCIWTEKDDFLYHGEMPWLPVSIELGFFQKENELYNISYNFICENDFGITKVDLVFPLNDFFEISFDEDFDNNYFEYIKNGLNLKKIKMILHYKEKKISFSFKSELLFTASMSKTLHSQKTLKITFYFDHKYFKKGKYALGISEFYCNI